MTRITIQVDAPSEMIQGVKEDIATRLEKFGDAKVVEVQNDEPEQMRISVGGVR